MASIELGKRLSSETNINKIKITNAESVFNYYKNILKDEKQEYFYCIYLDTKNNIIKDKMLFKGTINQSLVHPREVFKEAYLLSATSLICVHNHPSGSVIPSSNDEVLTKQLVKSGQLLGIKVLDHIIVGKTSYFSFLEKGMM